VRLRARAGIHHCDEATPASRLISISRWLIPARLASWARAGDHGWIDSLRAVRRRVNGRHDPDIGAWASNSAGKKDRNTDYTENSRQAMADMARTTLENSINIPQRSIRIHGEIINLITGEDIDFSNIYTQVEK
jgi:hypothetical protein